MDIKARIESLTIKHRELDKEIQWCYSRYINGPSVDKMKKEKLLIKDQIEQLSKEIDNHEA